MKPSVLFVRSFVAGNRIHPRLWNSVLTPVKYRWLSTGPADGAFVAPTLYISTYIYTHSCVDCIHIYIKLSYMLIYIIYIYVSYNTHSGLFKWPVIYIYIYYRPFIYIYILYHYMFLYILPLCSRSSGRLIAFHWKPLWVNIFLRKVLNREAALSFLGSQILAVEYTIFRRR